MQEFLKELFGDAVTEETMASFHEELGKRFVSKADFNRRGEELKAVREEHAQMAAEFTAMQEASGEAERLKQALETEQKRHAEEMETFIKEEQAKQLKTALDRELTAVGARNVTAVKALLDMGKISLVDGVLQGLSEQVWELKRDNNFLFDETTEMVQFIKPAAAEQGGISQKDFQKMGYMERLKLKKEQPHIYQMMKQK